ncbi:MAG: hypothetical protein HYX39_13235 [Bacteroidetes bacterium]|nr:hypothetical protein [Bacteroidota bacterium]
MKKYSLLIVFTFLTTWISAQDMIVKKDGAIVKAKITEVGEESIKYKKSDNPDGPTYSISKDNITSINYANGEVEKFADAKKQVEKKENEDEDKQEEGEEKPKKNEILDDPNLKKTVEGIARDVGEQLLRSCANGKIDNSTTEVYWDQTFKDAISKEINIAIKTSWKPKWTDGSGKWIKGKIVVKADGSKKWVYQNDNGLAFSSCPKGFKIQ